jgi:hypothetical protein
MQAFLPQERSFGNMLAMGKFHRRLVRERLELEKLYLLPKLCIVSSSQWRT